MACYSLIGSIVFCVGDDKIMMYLKFSGILGLMKSNFYILGWLWNFKLIYTIHLSTIHLADVVMPVKK